MVFRRGVKKDIRTNKRISKTYTDSSKGKVYALISEHSDIIRSYGVNNKKRWEITEKIQMEENEEKNQKKKKRMKENRERKKIANKQKYQKSKHFRKLLKNNQKKTESKEKEEENNKEPEEYHIEAKKYSDVKQYSFISKELDSNYNLYDQFKKNRVLSKKSKKEYLNIKKKSVPERVTNKNLVEHIPIKKKKEEEEDENGNLTIIIDESKTPDYSYHFLSQHYLKGEDRTYIIKHKFKADKFKKLARPMTSYKFKEKKGKERLFNKKVERFDCTNPDFRAAGQKLIKCPLMWK